MKKLIYTTLFLFSIVNIQCYTNVQSSPNNIQRIAIDDTQFFYKHFAGTINDDIEIIMSLNRNKNSLSGYYYYKKIGIQIFIDGSIDEKNNIILNEYDKNSVQTGTFIGILNNDKLSGTWQNPTKTKNFKFNITEDYSNSVKFEVLCQNAEYQLFEIDTFPFYSIEIKYLNPVSYENNLVLNSLQNSLLHYYFAEDIIEKTPKATINTFIDTLINIYKTYNEIPEYNDYEYISDAKYQFTWDYTSEWVILYNEKDKLSIAEINYIYEGGAHGLGTYNLFNYDLKTNKKIVLSDIIKKAQFEELQTIILQKLDENGQTEMLFSLDDVKPTENFFLSSDGITFIYNPYEIAPYVVGIIEVFIEYKKIENLRIEN